MNENKPEFKLSLGTRIKAHLSTALLIFGGVSLLMAKTPQLVFIGGVCMLYSYLIGLDARQSATEELLKALLTTEKSDESNGQ